MSIDINWDALTSGEDGLALADKIREFVHAKFQDITLPRFIRSVRVHSFEFGAASPDVEIKDICDPLPDFYEDDDDDTTSGVDEDDDSQQARGSQTGGPREEDVSLREGKEVDGAGGRGGGAMPKRPTLDALFRRPSQIDAWQSRFRFATNENYIPSPLLGASTPGIPGGTSNLGYFHSPLAALSSAQTPLAAAVSGRHYFEDHTHTAPLEDSSARSHANPAPPQLPPPTGDYRPSGPVAVPRRGNVAEQSTTADGGGPSKSKHTGAREGEKARQSSVSQSHDHEVRAEDMQVVCRVRYSGDVKLSLTAEILLDYPMPSFLGIPLHLNITGLTFDGVAIIAWTRGRAHFCFLSPEDASASLGGEEVAADISERQDDSSGRKNSSYMRGLLKEIRVESEIGQMENGKQSLKNVGKVEKFVLEQVRKIFEEELVYPSFWTFLI